jgi:hypothetical protein
LFSCEALFLAALYLHPGEESHCSVSFVERCSVQGIPHCDHESTRVAPVSPRNKCAAAASAVYLQRGILRAA